MIQTINRGVIKYYAIPFTPGGITLRLDISLGYITCYISDTVRNPGPDNYVWLIENQGGYTDIFIDPTCFGRLGTRYVYVTVVVGTRGYLRYHRRVSYSRNYYNR